jgi:hypothetical protein
MLEGKFTEILDCKENLEKKRLEKIFAVERAKI